MRSKVRANISINFKMANEKQEFCPLLERDVKITVKRAGSQR